MGTAGKNLIRGRSARVGPAIYDVPTVTSVEIYGARTPELEGALDSYAVTWRGTAQGSIPDVS